MKKKNEGGTSRLKGGIKESNGARQRWIFSNVKNEWARGGKRGNEETMLMMQGTHPATREKTPQPNGPQRISNRNILTMFGVPGLWVGQREGLVAGERHQEKGKAGRGNQKKKRRRKPATKEKTGTKT